MKPEYVNPEPIELYLLKRAETSEARYARLRRMLANLAQMARDENPELGAMVRTVERCEQSADYYDLVWPEARLSGGDEEAA